MKTIVKNLALVFLLFLSIAALFSIAGGNFFESPEKVSLTKLIQEAKEGKVKSIAVEGENLNIVLKDGKKQLAHKEKDSSLTTTLKNLGLSEETIGSIDIEPKGTSGWKLFLTNVLPILLPLLLIGVFFWFMFRQAQQGQSRALTFGKTKAKLFSKSDEENDVTFDDVGGIKEAKEELKEVIEFLKNPTKFLKLGAKPPRGVLLVGPPGCGKTLLARAVANEADVPFFNLSGSEFIEMFVGVGASVTGDTPVLIRKDNEVELTSIGKFVDSFYKNGEEGGVKKAKRVKALGYDSLETGFRGVNEDSKVDFFGNSDWSNIQGVYRHKVDEIYEIDYLGGTIKTTGDHSVFVRENNFIKSKEVDQLEEGDVLVNLPFKVRGEFSSEKGTTHKVKAHKFENDSCPRELEIWQEGEERKKAYQFALEKRGLMTQKEIAQKVGVHKTTVGAWQRGEREPLHLKVTPIPEKVEVSSALMWLMGAYTAEGRGTNNLEFTFGASEKELHQKCIRLMREVFSLEPTKKWTNDNALRIKYYSPPLGRFFARHCGNGSENKHIPQFLWQASKKEYFLSYLKGYSDGDGYITKEGKLSITSVSERLIRELVWLASMHGIKAGVREETIPGGRIIKNKPLPETKAWKFIVGKTANPFLDQDIDSPKQYKKPIIKKITKKSYDGYVYDLCGCDNEAFFGGKNPILLHNSRVRDTFKVAKKNAPSILFIDELDAIGRQRGAGLGGGHDEREQTLNQILTEMDGFDKNSKVIVMAATNRPDILDPALLRPGRFDRQVTIDNPDIKARKEILEIHAEDKPFADDVDLREVAERTPGFSGADLENLINEAAILTAMKGEKEITQQALLDSVEKVLLGRERESHILSEEEKKISAYHEAGHALVSALLPDTDPVHKVSIVSRGQTGGYTLKLPTEDKHFKSRKEFLSDLASLLGGYTAEKLIFDDLTTGASNDLQRATGIARKLVTKYGMSEKLGPVAFGQDDGNVFLGKEIHEKKNYSEEVAAEIDGEVSRFIEGAREKAKEILKKHKGRLEEIAQTLIEKETIEKSEFKEIVKDLIPDQED